MLDSKNVPRAERVVLVEQPHAAEATLQVLSRQQEGSRLAGREESAMALALCASELREASIQILVADEQRVERLWSQVRHQREDQDEALVEPQAAFVDQNGIGRRVAAQVGWREITHVRDLAGLAKMQTDASAQHRLEPRRFALQA